MAENTLSRQSSSRGWSRSFGLLNPLRAVWWLFTNVRFAVVLLAVLCAVSLLGVVLPQMPLNVRGDVVAEQQWLDVQEGEVRFPHHRPGPCSALRLFHARWFAVLLALTSVSTGAYVLSRVPGVWRAITQPRKRVPDRYFDMAPDRLNVEGALDIERLVTALRRSRYRVERFTEGGHDVPLRRPLRLGAGREPAHPRRGDRLHPRRRRQQGRRLRVAAVPRRRRHASRLPGARRRSDPGGAAGRGRRVRAERPAAGLPLGPHSVPARRGSEALRIHRQHALQLRRLQILPVRLLRLRRRPRSE